MKTLLIAVENNPMYRNLFKILLVAFITCCQYGLQAQIITTMAGTGSLGYSGDGDLAAFCELYAPSSMAIDKVGNIYISDPHYNVIRKIDVYGIITTYAGTGIQGMSGDGGQAKKAKMYNQNGICLDAAGNLYIADTKNNRIRKIDTGGVITTIIGNGVASFGGDDSLAINARLNGPLGVAIDKDGNIFISDSYNNRIRKVNTAGIITTVAGTGVASFLGDGGPATKATMNFPHGIAVDKNGNVFFSDNKNQRVRRINAAGIISTVAGNSVPGYGGDQGVPFHSQVSSPTALVVDHKGSLYLADYANNRVRKIDTNGVITTICGNGLLGSRGDAGAAGDAEVYLPDAVAVDTADNVYIGESDGRVRFVYEKANQSDSISVFPNPCKEKTELFLYSKYEELVTVEIINTSGRIVGSIVGPTNRFITVKLDGAGLYVIYAVSKHNRWTGKIVNMHTTKS